MACKICGNNNCATYPGWSSIIRPCIPKDAKLGTPPKTPPALGRPPIKNQPGIIPTDTYIETEMQTIIRLLTQIWSKMNES